MAIVGVRESKSAEDVAHCIANQVAYGIAGTFEDFKQDVLAAIRHAAKLESNQPKERIDSEI